MQVFVLVRVACVGERDVVPLLPHGMRVAQQRSATKRLQMIFVKHERYEITNGNRVEPYGDLAQASTPR